MDALIMKWNELAKHMARDGDDKIPVDFSLVICELSKAPTVDAVEVVRCRDCKYFDSDFRWCDRHRIRMYGYDFCCLGERKDGDGYGG